MGDVGTGKTHMASALCQLACDRRLEPRFFTASSLVMRLRRARDEGRLDREAAQIGRAALLVIDELGFLPLDADGARLVFQVFADAYERQSVVITTNLEFSPLGIGLRGRPDGGCGHRPHRASRQARAVQRRVVPRTPRTHVGAGCSKMVRTFGTSDIISDQERSRRESDVHEGGARGDTLGVPPKRPERPGGVPATAPFPRPARTCIVG